MGWSFSFLLAIFLVGSVLQATGTALGTDHVVMLDNHTAVKLLVHAVKPAYPPIAKLNYIQGAVKVRLTVSSKGKVVKAHVLEGEPLLAAAALEAVRKWQFRPYTSSGSSKPFSYIVGIDFQLHPRVFGTRLPSHPNSFLKKQIRPPQVVARTPADPSSDAAVKFKVLVNSSGKLLDAVPIGAKQSDAKLAKKSLRRWKFLPARWGAIAVPWYLIVKVPLLHALVDQAANSTGR